MSDKKNVWCVTAVSEKEGKNVYVLELMPKGSAKDIKLKKDWDAKSIIRHPDTTDVFYCEGKKGLLEHNRILTEKDLEKLLSEKKVTEYAPESKKYASAKPVLKH